MTTYQQITRIRTRKLGILIYDARSLRKQTVDSCAEAMGISPETYKLVENGEIPPTLPQLESLAYFLDMPLEHFWGDRAVSTENPSPRSSQSAQLAQIRQRMIAAQLQLARNNSNMSTEELSDLTAIADETIVSYETGTVPVTLPDLEIICQALQVRVEDFFDQRGPIGQWHLEKLSQKKFLELSEDVREFISSPTNQPYITIAQRLSELPAEKLRIIAENLLEITF